MYHVKTLDSFLLQIMKELYVIISKHIHPNEHKLAAYRYYIERMLNLPLNAECQTREWSTILHIAQHNVFPPTIIQKLIHQIKIRQNAPRYTQA